MYKTVDEASAHLKRVHFRGKDELDLSQLAHLKRTHRYVPNLLRSGTSPIRAMFVRDVCVAIVRAHWRHEHRNIKGKKFRLTIH
jgi:hypothetical protein